MDRKKKQQPNKQILRWSKELSKEDHLLKDEIQMAKKIKFLCISPCI